MAIIKDFSNGKTGIRVNVKINHNDKTIRARMLDSWANGYNNECNGKTIEAWMEYKKDMPLMVSIAGMRISAEFKEQEQTQLPNRRSPDYRNKFSVAVSNGIISKTFDYTMSINDADRGIVNMSDKDKITAFYCIVQDAISGHQTFEEFKSEMGYTDCCEAHRIWKLCKESALNLSAVVH